VELRDLWRRYKVNADNTARDRLVVAYSPLAKYVAGRMTSGMPAHVDEADLISYGLVGLSSAIERFDPKREIKFETYAIKRISGAIVDQLRALDWVPRATRARAREFERANARLESRLHRAPSDEEMSAELRMSVDEFNGHLLQLANSPVAALSGLRTATSPGAEEAVTLLDTLADPATPDPAQLVDAWDLRDRIADATALLPTREKLVIALYYYENLTLREIAEVLGVSQSRVFQFHTKAVLRLRSSVSASSHRD
jgi:RNA polymerase sigma factor for flagellar operon FliA